MFEEDAKVVSVFGLPVDNVSMDEAVSRIDAMVQGGQVNQIATANLDFVRNARLDPRLQRVICNCAMVLADGAPILWASRLLGHPVRERVTGVDLVPRLARLSAEKGYRIFLLGACPESARRAQGALRTRFPGVQFAGHYAPPVSPLNQLKDDEIVLRIREAQPDILLVAFGNPKQELWLARNLEALRVPVCIGIGGALEMIGGTVRRAPRFVRAIQMEWLYRMAQEPHRLLPRYTRDLVALFRFLPAEWLASVRQPHSDEFDDFGVAERERIAIIHTPHHLTGSVCSWLAWKVKTASAAGKDITLDMTATTRVEADGVGCLLDVRRQLASAGRRLHVAGVSGAVQRVFAAASLMRVLHLTMAAPQIPQPSAGPQLVFSAVPQVRRAA